MSEDLKTSPQNGAPVPGNENEQEQESVFSFQQIFAMLVINWQWFLISLIICIFGALIYLRYSQPVYSISAKVLVKDEKKNRSGSQVIPGMEEFGILSNTAGFDNELEILQSTLLSREAVKRLKLYSEYYMVGNLHKSLVYADQPLVVDLESEALDSLDINLMSGVRLIEMEIVRKDNGYDIEGKWGIDKPTEEFSQHFDSLPGTFYTDYGLVSVAWNPAFTGSEQHRFNHGYPLRVTIRPPMIVARQYLKAMTVSPTSKTTSIAAITLKDASARRGIDFLNTLVQSYNDQANEDKNEIALKTEEFINERLAKIDNELGTTESSLEQYKRSNAVTNLTADAAQNLQMSGQYSSRLSEANAQLELLDYLRKYVDNPANQYKLIPSAIGMSDQASTQLITSYNTAVQERNRLLKAASAQSPQVITLTATLDELQSSIRQALLQARQTAEIQRNSIQNQYTKYQSRIGSTPEQERVLNQIGRQQEVRSGLYLMLLQKREENSISLAATADKGKLIDIPQNEGKVSPKNAIILLIALVLGLGIPFGILLLLQLLRFRIEGHDDVAKLTNINIIADVPVASDSVKDAAGIVVQANKNNQIDEIFRSMRTNIQFMMKEHDQVILFTSSTSGEGKTFLAANLAVSFALLGKKVVLCGMDIRKPALGKLFNIQDRKQGITNLLVKEKVTEADIKTELCNSGVNPYLDLLLAGPTPPNPTELLARENLSLVIELLKQKYDYIILDTAPVGLVTDTLEIAKFTCVSCYVCRADYTPKSNLGILNMLAAENKLPNPCVIINGVDMSKKKYGYYYGYGTYGKYGRYGNYGRYGSYGRYGNYGNYGSYGNYMESHYSNKNDDSIKR